MNKFIMAVTCPYCGEIVRSNGWSVDFTTDENVVLLDTFSQNEFYCKECDTHIYVGDIDDCIDYELDYKAYDNDES